MANTNAAASAPVRALQKIVEVRAGEVRALLVSCAYFFFVLSSYYVLRPIRDEMGVAGGVENLAWLFTGTLLGTLAAQPLFGAVVARYPRRKFIPYTYRFFALNILAFWALLNWMPPESRIWVGRAFFIWVSVFNMFVVSVFWAFMADIFRSEQGKRLFGFIGVGGTLGAILGGVITAAFVRVVGTANLLLVSVLLLEVAVWCVLWLGRVAQDDEADEAAARRDPDAEQEAVGGGVMAGVTHVLGSSYLLGICLYMLLYTIGSTFLYFQQADIVEASIVDRAARTAFFAKVDIAVNVLTIVTQAAITGRLLRVLGVAITLALLPALSVLGFVGLGLVPALGIVVVFQTLRRAGNFAVARPTREVLFTVVSREDKYKAKSFIDTFVYRGGDQVGAWSYSLLGLVGIGVAGAGWIAAALSAGWLGTALWLGRRQRELAARDERSAPRLHVVPAAGD